jgi:hypothetical protein
MQAASLQSFYNGQYSKTFCCLSITWICLYRAAYANYQFRKPNYIWSWKQAQHICANTLSYLSFHQLTLWDVSICNRLWCMPHICYVNAEAEGLWSSLTHKRLRFTVRVSGVLGVLTTEGSFSGSPPTPTYALFWDFLTCLADRNQRRDYRLFSA